MQILDGKVVSAAIQSGLKEKIASLPETERPHLAAILVGNDPASETYVHSKVRHCNEIGITSSLFRLEDSVSEEELVQKIKELNGRQEVHGILVQLPLPKHISEQKIINTIDPDKDVDGFHPVNVGRMVLGLPGFVSATPLGIMMMLSHYGIDTVGKHVVVIGRSNIVGTPVSLLLSRNTTPGNATVTLCHSKTKNLKELCLQADILVAAIGRPGYVTADMVKEGAVVIDVGINRVQDDTKKKGYALHGDVDYEQVSSKASFITPVPGGVGLMTIAALLSNTLDAYERQSGRK